MVGIKMVAAYSIEGCTIERYTTVFTFGEKVAKVTF